MALSRCKDISAKAISAASSNCSAVRGSWFAMAKALRSANTSNIQSSRMRVAQLWLMAD
jgi:hypothetical protein